jgi:hypothetical protein
MSSPVSSVPHPSSWLLALFTAAMMALALGALWAVVALLLQHGRYALAVPVGIGIAQTLRAQNIARTYVSGLLAIVLTLLASAYAQALLAIGDLAQTTGLTFREAFVRFDPGFALLLAQGRVETTALVWTCVAALLAAWWAWRR